MRESESTVVVVPVLFSVQRHAEDCSIAMTAQAKPQRKNRLLDRQRRRWDEIQTKRCSTELCTNCSDHFVRVVLSLRIFTSFCTIFLWPYLCNIQQCKLIEILIVSERFCSVHSLSCATNRDAGSFRQGYIRIKHHRRDAFWLTIILRLSQELEIPRWFTYFYDVHSKYRSTILPWQCCWSGSRVRANRVWWTGWAEMSLIRWFGAQASRCVATLPSLRPKLTGNKSQYEPLIQSSLTITVIWKNTNPHLWIIIWTFHARENDQS